MSVWNLVQFDWIWGGCCLFQVVHLLPLSLFHTILDLVVNKQMFFKSKDPATTGPYIKSLKMAT